MLNIRSNALNPGTCISVLYVVWTVVFFHTCSTATTVSKMLWSSRWLQGSPLSMQLLLSTLSLASRPLKGLITALPGRFGISLSLGLKTYRNVESSRIFSEFRWIHAWELFVWLKHKFVFLRNILLLLNAFELPEDSITEDNYVDQLTSLNNTSPDIIQNLDIKICDMQQLLSEVASFSHALQSRPKA